MPVQTVVVATPQTRTGTFTSPSVQIPASVLRLKFIANLLTADKLSDGLTFTMDVQHSVDGATNWLPVAAFGWTSYGAGGFTSRDDSGTVVTNPDPSLAFAPNAFPQHFFRMIVVVPQALSIGLTVLITT